ncbi:MAG TPA: hypothetical protein VFE14_18920 [Micromonosporaceae bacterium]|nr:hypothetical protein [Micromonosporaceae bacterium]
MAHVELSLSESLDAADPVDGEPITNLDRWVSVAAVSEEPCLIIDSSAVILAMSPACGELFGLGDPTESVGRFLLGGVLRMVDFTAARTALTYAEADKIPPLLALSSGRLARGLMRVQCRHEAERMRTVDAIATPIWEGATTAGSLTFFSEI